MVRPKKDTPAGRRATEKWRQTMLEKYGEDGIKEHAKRIGSLGGRVKGPKGFALNRERAVEAGRKGGLKSRRTGVATGQGKQKFYCTGEPKPEVKKCTPKTNVPEQEPKTSFIKRIFGGK